MADFLHTLDDIPADRVRWNPFPGTATEADAIRLHESRCYCELVDGTLVEKPMSAPEGFLEVLDSSSISWPSPLWILLGK